MVDQNEDRVLVCGSGLSGLTAAITALQSGVPVTLLEKAPEPGGTTALARGSIWTYSDYDKMRADIPDGDAVLQWRVFDDIDDARSWLVDQGVKLEPEHDYRGFGRGRRMNPPQAVGALVDKFISLGGKLRLETALGSLIVENGAVRGVRATRNGHVEDHRARAVVLATGGFQGNPELLARYVVRDPDNLYLRSNYWSTGDGFIAATEIGAAASRGLDTFYGHALAAPPARFTKLQYRDVSQSYGRRCVAVNLRGERFADESDSNTEAALNQRLAQQPSGRGFYIVDQKTMDSPAIEGEEILVRVSVERAKAANGPVVKADSIDDLCSQLASFGVPQKRVLRELTAFNESITSGEADHLIPPRRGNRYGLHQPPFYAVAVKASITYTMGGLQIDDRARVLLRSAGTSTFVTLPPKESASEPDDLCRVAGSDFRETAIEGLYAAGCDTGNISHFGYMGGLAPALVTGRLAGRSASQFIREATPGIKPE